MFTFGPLGGETAAVDPLFLLLIALLIDAYFGDPKWFYRLAPHPVALIGRLIGGLEKKLNREHRSQMDRAVRGLLSALFVIAAAGAVGLAAATVSLHHPWGWILEVILLITLVAGRSLYDHVREVAVSLREGLEPGREAVSFIVGRDPAQLDQHGVARAAIESTAENFSDGIVAPVFWYVLFGLPGICIYKAVNTMDSMIGHKTDRYRAYGMPAARLDDILNLIPARLSGLFICLASAFVPTARPLGAVKTMLRDAGKHRSPNAGWPEAAMAGALHLSLAGPRRYSREIVTDPWLGDGTAKAKARDINRALYVFVVACLINGAWVAALAVVRYSLPAGT